MKELTQIVETALRNHDEDSYRISTQNLLDVGYIPVLMNDAGKIEVEFIGPIASEEKDRYSKYLESILEHVTFRDDVDEQEDSQTHTQDIRSGFLSGLIVGGAVVGFLYMAMRLFGSTRRDVL